jgi:hypothetical protein
MSDSGTNVQPACSELTWAALSDLNEGACETSPTYGGKATLNTALGADDEEAEQHPTVLRGADTSPFSCGSEGSRGRREVGDESYQPCTDRYFFTTPSATR